MNATPINLRKLNDEALCRLCDDLGNQAWECRQRRWTRKLEQVRSELGRVTMELDRRIKRNASRRKRA